MSVAAAGEPSPHLQGISDTAVKTACVESLFSNWTKLLRLKQKFICIVTPRCFSFSFCLCTSMAENDMCHPKFLPPATEPSQSTRWLRRFSSSSARSCLGRLDCSSSWSCSPRPSCCTRTTAENLIPGSTHGIYMCVSVYVLLLHTHVCVSSPPCIHMCEKINQCVGENRWNGCLVHPTADSWVQFLHLSFRRRLEIFYSCMILVRTVCRANDEEDCFSAPRLGTREKLLWAAGFRLLTTSLWAPAAGKKRWWLRVLKTEKKKIVLTVRDAGATGWATSGAEASAAA